MNTAILAISGISIKQDSHGRFCLNDLHKAAGGEARHKPANWLRIEQSIELIKVLESENLKFSPLETVLGKGKQQGTFVVKELVYAYATWISAKFFLTVIRAYDAMVSKPAYALRDLPTATPKSITPAMQRQVQKAIANLVRSQVGTTYSGLYGQIKDKFGVGTYKDVPFKQYGELCAFLNIEPIVQTDIVESVQLPEILDPNEKVVRVSPDQIMKVEDFINNVFNDPQNSHVIVKRDVMTSIRTLFNTLL
ncbi:MAG: KilA-N domain-containing protein [Methylococcaceae bacterium]